MPDPEKKGRRFDFLEHGKSPGSPPRPGLPQVGRFDHLEIGEIRKPSPGPPPETNRKACPRCGQPNETEREVCWACHKALERAGAPGPAAGEAPPQEITLVLDGLTYSSKDPALPEDIRELMSRVAKRGFSRKLLEDWREEREALRQRAAGGSPPADETRVEVFQGQRVSVIKLDGRVYLSDAKDLPQRIRDLFDYIERNGVTPELLENLRGMGQDVRLRPATTAMPSDGDLQFWREVEARRRDLAQPARAPAWPDFETAVRTFYYLAPAWFLVEASSWPFFRAGLVTGGSGPANFLFYAMEACIGAGYWRDRPWAPRAAFLENLGYLVFALLRLVAAPVFVAMSATPGALRAELPARDYHYAIPSVVFSVLVVRSMVRRWLDARRHRAPSAR